ncbi:hypothetical protein MASR1M29_23230 [Cloacibacterium normanense]
MNEFYNLFDFFLTLNGYNSIELKKIKHYLLSHPEYPNLNSVEKTFNYFNISNIISEFTPDDFDSLPDVFIFLKKNNNFYIAKKTKNKDFIYVISNNSKKKQKKSDFLNEWTGLVIAIEESKKYFFNRIFSFFYKKIILLFVSIFALYSILNLNTVEIIFNLLSILGFFLSVEIFKNSIDIKSETIDKICTKSSEHPSDSCSKIINSNQISFLGLKVSDFSLFYFSTLSILGLFIDSQKSLISIFSLFSLFSILYSLYIQIFKEKTFCKICITIILILLLQFIVSNIYFLPLLLYNYSFSTNVIISIFTLFIIFALLVFLFRENKSITDSQILNLKFKKNYSLFKQLLYKEKKIFFNHNLFFFGSKNSKIHLSLIYSLNCNYCSDSFQLYKNIFSKYSSFNNISFEIRFNFNSTIHHNHQTIKTILCLKKIYETDPNNFLNALEYWYKEKKLDKFLFNFSYSNFYDDTDVYNIFAIRDENLTASLNYTPIVLINGYKFPVLYENSDILYFIDEILEDEDNI